MSTILMSIKPKYVDKIFSGEKNMNIVKEHAEKESIELLYILHFKYKK